MILGDCWPFAPLCLGMAALACIQLAKTWGHMKKNHKYDETNMNMYVDMFLYR